MGASGRKRERAGKSASQPARIALAQHLGRIENVETFAP
jgi:hypothetical protein